MWPQLYTPATGSLSVSSLVAAVPIFVLLLMLGVARRSAWAASLTGVGAALLVALFWYRMPPLMAFSAAAFGAAFGLFPIVWIVFWAILLYRITVESGRFEIIKDSVGGLTADHRIQALLIAFAFGAFIEGAAGFGTPVAVAAAMLSGLGFSPFYAAAICLLANTAPVAFGSIGIPLVTLQGTTGLPLSGLSANVGRICAPLSLIIPAYLVLVVSGLRGLRGVWPAAALCGLTFASTQFLVSSFIGPYLTDIIGSLCAIAALILLLRFWKPKKVFLLGAQSAAAPNIRHSASQIAKAWLPYGFLVAFVLLWGTNGVKTFLDSVTVRFPWPALHNLVIRVPPVTSKSAPYPAVYTFNFLTASGTACMFAVLATVLALGIRPRQFAAITASTTKQLLGAIVTTACVLSLAFVMNYCGATATLGLAFAGSGPAFPFFSALLGWIGVFLTGSDTSANALFGNLQVVTANTLHLNPVLMAAANSSGGVMGKMISLQSIAIAAAATSMPRAEESKLFRFTLRHSILLASLIGLITLFYAYAKPGWTR
jgi:L-lactate transport